MKFNDQKHFCTSAHEAIVTYNDGNILRCNILKTIGIHPGTFCAKAMKKLDVYGI